MPQGNANNSTQILEIVELMDGLLSEITGLDDFQRKQVIYYTLATHALKTMQSFPTLVLKGPTGCGKTSCLEIIAKFAYRPHKFNLKSMTLPTIRDELCESHDGTAIIEEADQAWKNADGFESMLSDRYMRATAKASRKIADGRDWITRNSVHFGATVLHRRLPFVDAALSGRSIIIMFRAVSGRTFSHLGDILGTESIPLGCLDGLTLPDVQPISGIAGRVFDTYKPVLALAQIVEDKEFAMQMKEHLKLESIQLKESQSSEPDALALRGLIQRITKSSTLNPDDVELDFSRNIRVSDIAKSIFEMESVTMTPRQVAALLRDLGFQTANRAGATTVVPRPAALLRACSHCQYTDNDIETLRKKLRIK
jgi:hypothetical protein